MAERTGKRTARTWRYHADCGWPYIEIGADGNPRAVSGSQLEHSHAGGNVPHTHRLIVVPHEPAPDDPHPDSLMHDPRFKVVRDDTPIYAATGGAGRTTLTAADTGERRIIRPPAVRQGLASVRPAARTFVH